MKTSTAIAIGSVGVVLGVAVAVSVKHHHPRVEHAAAAVSRQPNEPIEPIDPACRERCAHAGDKETGAWSGAQDLEAKARAVDIQMCETSCDIDRKFDRIDKKLGR